jgi:hypothetical protein
VSYPPDPSPSSLSHSRARTSSSEERHRTEPLRRVHSRLRPTPVTTVPRIALARPLRTLPRPLFRLLSLGAAVALCSGEPPPRATAGSAAPATSSHWSRQIRPIRDQRPRLDPGTGQPRRSTWPTWRPRQRHVVPRKRRLGQPVKMRSAMAVLRKSPCSFR